MQRVKAEKRFNDVRNLANSFLFEITPEIENLPGSTPAKVLLVKRAREYLNSLALEANDDPKLMRELAAAYEKVGDVQGNPYRANVGDMQGALVSYRRARKIREQLLRDNPNDFALKSELANNTQLVGDILYNTGEIESATALYQEALQSHAELSTLRPNDPNSKIGLATAHYSLGRRFFWNSEYEKAKLQLKNAESIFTKLSQSDPDNRNITNKLANVYILLGETAGWQGEFETSQATLLKALKMLEPLVSKEPLNASFRNSFLQANTRLGESYLDLEDFEKSLFYYRIALDIAKRNFEADTGNVAAKYNLALV